MEIPVTAQGELAAVDTSGARAELAALHGTDEPARARALDAVLAQPQRRPPPVLMAAGAVLFHLGRRDEGAFWFYAGQVRTRFDIERCADPTVDGAATILRERYGPAVNAWAFADTARLRAAVERVVAWDRATPHDYDQRWINLHGMGAFTGGGEVSAPRGEWEAIAERVRTGYLRELDEVLGGDAT